MNFEGISQERLMRFACDCALVNIELIKPYTDEYDLIVEWLKNPTSDTAYAFDAYAAAYAADTAAADAADTAAADAAAAAAAAAATDYIADADAAADYIAAYAAATYDATYAAAYAAAEWAKIAGNPERIDALYEELMKENE